MKAVYHRDDGRSSHCSSDAILTQIDQTEYKVLKGQRVEAPSYGASSQPGDKVKYKAIGGATSKVPETTGTIVDVKGSGAVSSETLFCIVDRHLVQDAVYTIENENTKKKREYHVRPSELIYQVLAA